jgi:hypothetical protein
MTIAELVRDPEFQNLPTKERLVRFFEVAQQDRLYQQADPSTRAKVAMRAIGPVSQTDFLQPITPTISQDRSFSATLGSAYDRINENLSSISTGARDILSGGGKAFGRAIGLDPRAAEAVGQAAEAVASPPASLPEAGLMALPFVGAVGKVGKRVIEAAGAEERAAKEAAIVGKAARKADVLDEVLQSTLLDDVLKSTLNEGGATYNLVSKKNLVGTKAYAVAVHPDRELILDHEPTVEEIRDYVNKNRDLLRLSHKSLGTWRNPDNGQFYLDIVETHPDLNKALEIARKHNQISIYDLEHGQEIKVPYDTGGPQSPTEQTPGQGPSTEPTLKLEHYSPAQNLPAVDPEHFGTNAARAETLRAMQYPEGYFPKRSYFYIAGTEPEARFKLLPKYNAQVPESKIYDLGKDPLGFGTKYRDPTEREVALRDAGYWGYRNSALPDETMRNVVVLFRKTPVVPDEFKFNEGLRTAETATRAVKNELANVGAASILFGKRAFSDWQDDFLSRVPDHIKDQLSPKDVRELFNRSKEQFRTFVQESQPKDLARLIQLHREGSPYIDWYKDVLPTVRAWVGDDAELMIKIIAAASPLAAAAKGDDAANIPRAIRAYIALKESTSREEFIRRIKEMNFGPAGPAVRPNLIRIWDEEELSGPKVVPFSGNLSGKRTDLVTIDSQLFEAFGALRKTGRVADSPAWRQYIEAVVKRFANDHALFPMQSQAAIWSGYKFLKGLDSDDRLEPFRKSFHRIATERFDQWKHVLDITEPPMLDEGGKVRWAQTMVLGHIAAGAMALSDEETRDYLRQKLRSFGINMPPRAFEQYLSSVNEAKRRTRQS